jgi:hypothetical protein
VNVLRYPLHLIAIVAGMAAVAVVLWQVDPSGRHFAAYVGGIVALAAAIDLARRLGLEPKDDPAAPNNQQGTR